MKQHATWRLGELPRTVITDRRGAIGIQLALLLVILLAFIALAVEVTQLYVLQKRMQNAADAAVIVASTIGLSAASRTIEAKGSAASNGFVDGQSGITVAYNEPPLLGRYAGNPDAQEVIITRAYRPYLVSLLRPGTIEVRARATAFTAGKTPGCLLALAPTGTSISLGGNAVVTNSSCEVLANSTSATSLVMASGSSIAGAVGLVGGASVAPGATIGGRLQTYGAPVEDPYALVALPAAGACLTGVPTQLSGTRTISPGHYCSGINIANNAIITMDPGVYFVDTLFSVGNNAVINAVGTSGIGGVTVVLNTFAQPLSSANFAISNNVQWNINAPLTGATAGIAFTAAPNLTGSFQFNNNAVVTITGAMYLPSVNVTFQGQAKTTATSCSQLIARTITINSTVNFRGECPSTAIKRIGKAALHLVE